jgi:hypothetical protein
VLRTVRALPAVLSTPLSRLLYSLISLLRSLVKRWTVWTKRT